MPARYRRPPARGEAFTRSEEIQAAQLETQSHVPDAIERGAVPLVAARQSVQAANVLRHREAKLVEDGRNRRTALQLDPGDEISMRIDFSAHVLRGTYRISLHLADTNRLWEQIDISGLVSFVVHETTRVMGCAELNPTYEIHVAPAIAAAHPSKVTA
jgi:hypothetical protein